MRYLLILVLNSFLNMTFSIGLADFVPNFLASPGSSTATKKHMNESTTVEYAYSANVKSTTGKTNTDSSYCNDPNAVVSDSVFCNKQNPGTVHSEIVSNKSSYALSSSYRSNVAGNNLSPKQSAMQTPSLKNAMGKYSSSLMLPVKPNGNFDMGVGITGTGVNGVQFNLKY